MNALRARILATFVAVTTVALPVHARAAATIVVFNLNAAGVGFNDPTPVAPVGGNPGTTLGQQRLNVFQAAANIWGQLLDSPVPITIDASMEALTCTTTAAVFGSAGTTNVFSDFAGAPVPNTLYPVALANHFAGVDLDPAKSDLRARFNVNLGNPGCLDGVPFYLGLDGNHGSQIDLETVLLHEYAHGLGFASFANLSTGALFDGKPDIYSTFLLDLTTNKHWPEMTDAERVTSTTNTRNVVFDGPRVTAAIPTTLEAGVATLTVSSSTLPTQEILIGTASFGPLIGAPISADIVQAVDAVSAPGGGPTDACEPIIDVVTGKFALVDRGACTFNVKAKNVQDAGGVGMILVDNVPGSPPPGLGGSDPTITIPSVRITQADGTRLSLALLSAPVTATLQLDLTRRAGADAAGRALVFTPSPLAAGSSVSHFDTSAHPNLLMEPAINGDLTHDVDLTLPALLDLGWGPVDVDGDGEPDATDPCVDPAGAHDFVAALKPKLVLGKINTDLVAGNDTLTLTGQFASSAPFTSFTPLATGARLVLRKQAGGAVLDVALATGAYGGKGTRGWKTNKKVTMWTYQDTTATPLGGITRVVVADASKKVPDRVKIVVSGKKGSYPVVSGDEPVRAVFVLGGTAASQAGMCGESAFQPGDCSFSKNGKTLTCKQ